MANRYGQNAAWWDAEAEHARDRAWQDEDRDARLRERAARDAEDRDQFLQHQILQAELGEMRAAHHRAPRRRGDGPTLPSITGNRGAPAAPAAAARRREPRRARAEPPADEFGLPNPACRGGVDISISARCSPLG